MDDNGFDKLKEAKNRTENEQNSRKRETKNGRLTMRQREWDGGAVSIFAF